jgi:two-component system, sensor histidine kinase and response regulator
MTDESIVLPILLSAARASPGQQRDASLVVLTVLAASIATLPFATIAGPPLAGFVLVQQAWMGLTDLITAALLLGQFWVQPARRLNVLAGGYLFTALTTVPYALSFPGGLSDNGLFITGPLSTPWIFLTWYAALPLVVIAYGFSRGREKNDNRSDSLIGILLRSVPW